MKKVNHKEEDLHKIKKSVGEIFTFLYENLDQSSEYIKETIDGWVKDRDLTDLYVARF